MRPAPGAGPAFPARGGLTSPARGRAPRPSLPRSIRRSRSDGPRGGRVSWLSGPGGAARAGARTGAHTGGQRPRASVNPSSAYVSVSRLVCLSVPRGSGAVQSPRESAPRSPAAAASAWKARRGRSHPGLPFGPPRCAESRGYSQGPLVRAKQEARATAAVSSLAASSKTHPRALPSLAGCLEGSRPERAGERPGRRCRGVRKEGCPLWGWERRGEGAASGGAPPCRQTRELGTLAMLLPAATWLRLVLLQVQAGMGLQASGAAGSELQGALGAWWRGYRKEESISRGKGCKAGVLYAEFGVMIGRRHPLRTRMKKKW